MENEALSRPVHRVRWRNFRRLLADRELTITRAAEILEKSQGQVSHFGGKRPSKPIGDQIADEIELAFGLEVGALDNLSGSGRETVNELSESTGTASQISEPDEATLEQVLKWVAFEEGALGKYQPLIRLRRSIAILQLIQADGGTLSPAHSAELVEAVRLEKGARHDGRADKTGVK